MLFSGSSPRFYKTRHLDWFVYTFTILSSFVLRFARISFTKKNSTFLINYLNFHGICSNLEFWNVDTWGLYRIAFKKIANISLNPNICSCLQAQYIVQCCQSFKGTKTEDPSSHVNCLTSSNPTPIFTISVIKQKNWKESWTLHEMVS